MASVLLLCANAAGAPTPSPAPTAYSEMAASAAHSLQQHWYMAGANGSWIGRGPGAGLGQYDLCLANKPEQSCKCNVRCAFYLAT